MTGDQGSPYPAAMREIPEPTQIDLQSFSVVRILKDSWEISTKYFGALVMPMVVLSLCLVPFVFMIPGKPGEALTNLLSAIFSPIAIMGLQHSVLRLKSEGQVPTFGQTFSHGVEYWGRGILIGLLHYLYAMLFIIGAMIAAAIPLVSGTMLVEKYPIPGLILIGIGGLAFLGLVFWFLARTCLVYSAMADGLTSASRAFEYGWELTKNNVKKTISLGFALLGITVIIAFLFLMAAVFMAALGIEEDAVVAVLIFAWLLCYLFGVAYANVCLCITYQALKPAPKQIQ